MGLLPPDIPQANRVERVIQIAVHVARGEVLNPLSLGMHTRDIHYYTQAARLLGLVEDADHSTVFGQLLCEMNEDERLDHCAKSFAVSEIGRRWKDWSGAASLAEIDPKTAEQFLTEESTLAPSTAKRRAASLRGWWRTLAPRPMHFGPSIPALLFDRRPGEERDLPAITACLKARNARLGYEAPSDNLKAGAPPQWSVTDSRLSTWPAAQGSNPALTVFERRWALIECDVLVALDRSITAEELCTLYDNHFPKHQEMENNTWYDRNGQLVFTLDPTCQQGLGPTSFEMLKASFYGKPLPADYRPPKHGVAFEPFMYPAQLGPTLEFETRDRKKDMKLVFANLSARFGLEDEGPSTPCRKSVPG